MAFKRVNIDGADYVPIEALHILATPESKEVAALVAAAINMVRAEEDLSEEGGLARLDLATTKLKRAVRAYERRAKSVTDGH